VTLDPQLVADRLAAVRARLDAAGGHNVKILAVTKGFGPEALAIAGDLGLHDVGENYAQELIAKLQPIRPTGLRIHFIGRLQTNKVASLAAVVDVWQSIDRTALVDTLAKRFPGARAFVQVNVSEEPQKGGCPMDQADALVAYSRTAGLDVVGLMTVGKAGEPAEIAAGFRWLRATADRMELAECSMGMSGDLEIAVREGATMVRVGSALFGDRPGIHARNN
jgi:PLP dependent protein